MEKKRRTPAAINALLRSIAQRGLITQAQAKRVKIDRQTLARRVKAGFLERVRPGLFRLAGEEMLAETPRLSPGRQRAAIGATNADGLALWSANAWLGNEPTAPRHVHVVVPPGSHIQHSDWYRAHRLAPLADGDVVVHNGIRTTSAARTFRDFAAVLKPDDWNRYVNRWVEEALMFGRLSVDALERQRDRERAPHIRARLTKLIDYHSGRGTEDLKSRGEAWLRDFIERAGLPQPLFNARIPGTDLAADALWVDLLALEFDSYRHHGTRPKLARDARRRRRTSRHGGLLSWSVTADDLQHHRAELEDDIRWAVLERGAARLVAGS